MATTVQELVKQAEAQIETLNVEQALARTQDADTVFVDVRDVRELWREGKIPGAFHAPRCMLEFWIDPTSPYHKPIFASGKSFVFYCAAGWRSALSTQTAKLMGLDKVAHLGGGFGAWVKAGGQVETVEKK